MMSPADSARGTRDTQPPLNGAPSLSEIIKSVPEVPAIKAAVEATLTGSFTNYYLVYVRYPQRSTQPPYQAECEDLIQALGMTFDQGCEFKALWRTASAALGNGKPGRDALDQAIYDAEKRIHYATRDLNRLKQLKAEQENQK